jgi:bifunctional non-homologous end joining protein LigD
MVLDGEIVVPDERGVTHIDGLSAAIRERRPERLAYFAFDLLHLDGHDLRRCPIEDRKALLRDVIGAARCPRIVCVDHVVGIGRETCSRRCARSGPRALSPSGAGASTRREDLGASSKSRRSSSPCIQPRRHGRSATHMIL